MRCSNCGTENREGRKFCSECAAPLAVLCPNCGTANEPGERFCGECATPLAAGGALAPAAAVRAEAERRVVSVLFADLVGFTSLSEDRDAEEVRDLLSRYFDTCRRLVGLYGGTVEKFIGDAVMAVWGAPVAQEDDAERAVRTALDLVAAVAALGDESGLPGLRARAGVLSGEAAVTIGAEGQGMVAGDLVNTASRIQSAAAPGAVVVGEATRRATEAAIVYEEAGSHELKGKAEPVPLWRALRVVGGRGGALKSEGLEPPFVGRDRELRMLKDLFHASAEEGKAHLLSVVGIGGIGKSRLSWEFFKYLDGLSDTAWWHRGRCLSYGEGVTYWALAEMVRMRTAITEGEEAASALERLHAAIEEHVPDPDERRWIEPRLAHLLGLEERSASDPEDLFGAWRLFFERLTAVHPVVMVFEDLQWADASLMDFIEYLLDWSRNHPVFILTLARPELTDRRPEWGAGKRGFTSLYLEPLSAGAMEELLAGFVPGLPDALRTKIQERAEGVPLYAVETVRMLLDRGLLVQEGGGYRVVGEVDALEVPETLHALIAARLDGLSREERLVLQDAAVMGKTFSRPALASIAQMPEADLDPILAGLVRKEFLSNQVDPRSPERGQFGFLQDLVRRVAYETLSKKDRKALHLAAAAYLESSWGEEDEVVEVVASHLVEAYRLAPDAPDAGEIRARASGMLLRAGERAASLAAQVEALRYFRDAAELAEEPGVRAELLERAGVSAWEGGKHDEAIAALEEAIRLCESEERTHAAARVSARLAEVLWWGRQQLDEALERMEASFAVLSGEEEDEDLAYVAAQLGRMHFFRGELDLGMERIEVALRIAEALWLPEVLSEALNTKNLILDAKGRRTEALALLKHSLEVALENDEPTAAIRAYVNLSYHYGTSDRYEQALEIERQGVALARRVGSRGREWFLLGHMVQIHWTQGRWEEALALAAEIPDPKEEPAAALAERVIVLGLADISRARGDLDALQRYRLRLAPIEGSSDIQDVSLLALVRAIQHNALGQHHEALSAAMEAADTRAEQSIVHPSVRYALAEAATAAFALGDLEAAQTIRDIIESTPPGPLPPFHRALALRIRAKLGAVRGEQAEPEFRAAETVYREIGTAFLLAEALLEHGEWLVSIGRADDAKPLLGEAEATFRELEAETYLQRLAAVAPTELQPSG